MLPPLFQARRSIIRMNEQTIGHGAQRVAIAIGITKVRAYRNRAYFWEA